MVFILRGFLCAFLMIGLFLRTASAAPPDIHAQAAVLIDAWTGQILYDKKSRSRAAPASTTKIMTGILTVESGRLDETARVSAKAASTPGSSMHLYAGQQLTVRELLTGLLLRSGNDSAVALAEHLAGSEEAFVGRMNARATALGARDTQFRNPHGLSTAGHYTTAYDLAWIARHALTLPDFAGIVGTRETVIEWSDRRGREKDVNLRNTNRLLWMLEEADGVKTGTTAEAGPCLVASATRDGRRLISVVLHDHSRWYDSLRLLQYGFDQFELVRYAEEGDVLASLPVASGMTESVDAVATAQAAFVVPTADRAKLVIELDLPEKITAPVYQGQKLGEIVFFVDHKAVLAVDLVATHEVLERTPARVYLGHLTRFFRQLSRWGVL